MEMYICSIDSTLDIYLMHLQMNISINPFIKITRVTHTLYFFSNDCQNTDIEVLMAFSLKVLQFSLFFFLEHMRRVATCLVFSLK